jgi:hypothetical protein
MEVSFGAVRAEVTVSALPLRLGSATVSVATMLLSSPPPTV